MPGLTLTDRPASTRTTALGELRLALSMISSDPYAHGLLASEPVAPCASTPLTDWLYARWWCGPGLRAEPPSPTADTTRSAASRIDAERGAARLEAGRRTTARCSPGWLVLAAVGEVLVAARLTEGPADRPAGAAASDRRITTTPDAVVSSSRPGLPPRPGDLVTVRHGASGLDPAYAWWWAHATQAEHVSDGPLDRWYVHARDLPAAAALVPLVLAVAAEAGCALTLKCPPTESGYGRRDALVVYLPREHAPRAEEVLLRRGAEIAPHVRPDVPPLTRRLLPGVSRAEDPGRGGSGLADDAEDQLISYGQLRCGQVAATAVRLLREHPGQDPAGLDDDILAEALSRAGLDVDAVERVA